MTNKLKAIAELSKRDEDRFKRLYELIAKGVDIVDPFTTFIAEGVKIGKGTTIYPLTVIEEDVIIGKNCKIGPFARIRPHVRLKDEVVVGNFVEVNRSTMEKGAKAKHLTYLGDTTVGEKANIGAGTIVANYDGKEKHKTLVKKGAFIGSGSILVAPVTVGRNAMTGAGAVVTRNHNVPDNCVVVGIPARVFKKGEKK
ncbi:MAG TPA: DapH/DapD/GlmU-related protein [Candidatus Omnitrophota bacterium]|nr:DapH/DapD/GlmU-related protein [Candidatus Omnitrophota bacterium]HRZ15632.1 DapH/DapD/GlmU-related protein [Candidatus Omnitrophota bacterium]